MINYIGQDGHAHYLGESELMHYNHNHDKLGRFASSSIGARISYSSSLNRADNKHVKLRGKELRTTIAAEKTAKKLSKISKKNRPASYEKTKAKLDKQRGKIKSYQKQQKNIEAHIKKTIAKANKDGYNVKSVQTSESSQRAKDFATAYLAVRTGAVIAGPIGAAGGIVARNAIQSKLYESRYENRFGGQSPSNIQGNQFKVNKPKKGSKPGFSSETRYRTGRGVKGRTIGERTRTHSLYGNEQMTVDEFEKNRITKEKKKGKR